MMQVAAPRIGNLVQQLTLLREIIKVVRSSRFLYADKFYKV